MQKGSHFFVIQFALQSLPLTAMSLLSSVSSYLNKPDFGLLLLRVGVGSIMVLHGIPKFMGGKSMLEGVGSALSVYGLDGIIPPVIAGFLAATAEVFGGVLIVLGMFFKAAAFAIAFTMLTATLLTSKFFNADFGSYAYPLAMLTLFTSLMFIGPGSYSMDKGAGSKGGSKKKPAAE